MTFHKLLNPPFQMRRLFAELTRASSRKEEGSPEEDLAVKKRWP
jgi:hypothetical protein